MSQQNDKLEIDTNPIHVYPSIEVALMGNACLIIYNESQTMECPSICYIAHQHW